MSKQPEALRLADEADHGEWISSTNQWRDEAATELRRLHEVNQELLEALSVCLYHGDGMSENHQSYLPPSVRYKARSAIAKAEEQA